MKLCEQPPYVPSFPERQTSLPSPLPGLETTSFQQISFFLPTSSILLSLGRRRSRILILPFRRNPFPAIFIFDSMTRTWKHQDRKRLNKGSTNFPLIYYTKPLVKKFHQKRPISLNHTKFISSNLWLMLWQDKQERFSLAIFFQSGLSGSAKNIRLCWKYQPSLFWKSIYPTLLASILSVSHPKKLPLVERIGYNLH